MSDPVEAEIVTAPLAAPLLPPMMIEDVKPAPVVMNAVAASWPRHSLMVRREVPKQAISFPHEGRQVSIIVSTREYNFIMRLAETHNLRAVVAEFGMAIHTARRFTEKPMVNNYLAWRLKQKAAAAGLTVEKLMSKLNGAIDGTDPIDEAQLSAINLASRLLRPADSGTHVTFNQQNNISNGAASPAAASPYEKMGRGELIDEMRKVVSEAPEPAEAKTP